MTTINQTPIDEIDQDIQALCQRINVATYELLVLIREFDERGGWVPWGSNSCAEWLAWRCDLSIATAREKVRVAHALKTLPLVSETFSSGELSYAKVRSLTRVADREHEEALVEFALRHTAVHVADRCRELRCGNEASIDTAERAYANRSLRIRRDHHREMMTITIDLPVDSGALLEKALDKARDASLTAEVPDTEDTSWSTRQADAFVDVVTGFLSGNGNAEDCNSVSDNYLVTVHVDQSALAGKNGRSALPIESVRRLCCDGQAVVLTEGESGEPLSIGRKTRTVSTAISRAVRARDKHRCTFPGCDHRRYLQCHHVRHWSRGGETSLDNLVLLCHKHHTLVHEGGFRIERDFTNSWIFRRPNGIAVPDAGYFSRSYQHPPAGGLLSAVENSLEERPPPLYLH